MMAQKALEASQSHTRVVPISQVFAVFCMFPSSDAKRVITEAFLERGLVRLGWTSPTSPPRMIAQMAPETGPKHTIHVMISLVFTVFCMCSAVNGEHAITEAFLERGLVRLGWISPTSPPHMMAQMAFETGPKHTINVRKSLVSPCFACVLPLEVST